MNILILNWRDIQNPSAGGAEILTHELSKRWVRDGHVVMQISAGWQGSRGSEVLDGVEIVRLGRWWSVHILAFFYYAFRLRNRVDVVIDEVHWFPFFAKLYTPKKTVLLACEVAHRRFYEIFPYPVALLWRLVEKVYLAQYRTVSTLAISPSTQKELIAEGVDRRKITVIPMGVSVPEGVNTLKKEKRPTIIFLGRLNKLKGAMDGLKAFLHVKKKMPDARMWFVGTGEKEYVKKMQVFAHESGIENDVAFYGYVASEKKFELLSQAHVLIVPSVHEGWGLIVHEAGYVGTPAVVYDVSGLRDTVSHEKTGLITHPSANSLAVGIVSLLSSDSYQLFCKRAQKKARSLSWDKTANQAMNILKSVVSQA